MFGWLEAHEPLAVWLEAVGVVGTLLAAVWTLRMAVNDRRREQASGIVLVVRSTFEVEGEGEIESSPGSSNFEYRIQNRSNDIITGITFHVRDSKSDNVIGAIGDMPFLEPGPMSEPGPLSCGTVGRGQLYIEFRDANGRGWRRDQNGELRRCRRPTPIVQ